jgi:hypothetical protein
LASRGAIIQALVTILIAGAAYLLLTIALGSSEVKTLWGWIRRRA